MQFNHKRISSIIKDINTLKMLKQLHDFIGGQSDVDIEAFYNYVDISNDVFIEKIRELRSRGYIDYFKNGDDTHFKLTDEGNTVCGFIMTTLLDFYDSQQ